MGSGQEPDWWLKKETATEPKRKKAEASSAEEGFKLGAFLKGTKEELGQGGLAQPSAVDQ